MLFNINNLGDGIKCILSKCAGDTAEGRADTQQGCAAISRTPAGWRNTPGASTAISSSSINGSEKSCSQEGSTPCSSAEKDLRILQHKANKIQPRVLAAKTTSMGAPEGTAGGRAAQHMGHTSAVLGPAWASEQGHGHTRVSPGEKCAGD